jgi:hypothetical protein
LLVIPDIMLRGRSYDMIVMGVRAPTDDKSGDGKGRLYEELCRDHGKKSHESTKLTLN